MKIKTKYKTYEEVMSLPKAPHKVPGKPNRVLNRILNLATRGELKKVGFECEKINMERAGDGPWLILMNHSSFIDLKIAAELLRDRPFNIVCTSDGFVGKELFMRQVGCIPTRKFVTDVKLISDMDHALNHNHTSVLLYPEASYSFDGTATRLPRRMGVLFKKLKVPIVMITTFGAFARDPLYNNLQLRDVKVTAKMECLLTPDEIAAKKTDEIDQILDQAFSFDYFKWQKENNVVVDEAFRADGLNRILYKCPHCGKERRTEGKGTKLTCHGCGKSYTLTPLGELEADDGDSAFTHIPDWYKWEREEVRKEIIDGTYLLDTDVEIGIIVDTKALYMVGSGHLTHTKDGFVLTGCDGKLNYAQGSLACYSLYSDYYWYEIGDMICIGTNECLYYCFPKEKNIVAKARLAAEEIYKIRKSSREKRD